MENYLYYSIYSLFKKIEYYKGFLFHLNHDINNFTKRLLSENSDDSEYLIKGSRLIISDFTGETDDGWEINFPLPTEGYTVTNKNYKEKNLQLVNSVSSMLVVQAYEALESFFKEILIAYFENNQCTGFEMIGKANCIWDRKKANWEKTVRKLKQGENNRELLKLFRMLSPGFKEAEIDNNKNIDLAVWFNAISQIRHCIVHSDSILKNDDFNKLNKKEIDIVEFFFELQKLDKGCWKLSINFRQASDIMEFMCEYAFQVFKWLSISKFLNWRILKNMKKNEA